MDEYLKEILCAGFLTITSIIIYFSMSNIIIIEANSGERASRMALRDFYCFDGSWILFEGEVGISMDIKPKNYFKKNLKRREMRRE